MLREKDGKEMRHEKEMFRENATRDAKGNRFTGVQANCVCRISTIGRYPPKFLPPACPGGTM